MVPENLQRYRIAAIDRCHFYAGCERMAQGQSGGNYINPIQSAKLRTIDSVSLRYGKVEVRARLPVGDWLWPAIWMMPKYSAYGSWPASGEFKRLIHTDKVLYQ